MPPNWTQLSKLTGSHVITVKSFWSLQFLLSSSYLFVTIITSWHQKAKQCCGFIISFVFRRDLHNDLICYENGLVVTMLIKISTTCYTCSLFSYIALDLSCVTRKRNYLAIKSDHKRKIHFTYLVFYLFFVTDGEGCKSLEGVSNWTLVLMLVVSLTTGTNNVLLVLTHVVGNITGTICDKRYIFLKAWRQVQSCWSPWFYCTKSMQITRNNSFIFVPFSSRTDWWLYLST